MSTTGALHTSASLKADNAPRYDSMQGKLDPTILDGLKAMDFEFMTPVQAKVLNGLPSLKSDCLVQAKTGTGKTIAFLLPAIQNALTKPALKGQVAILIISPTRELALQIAAEASRLVARLKRPFEVHTAFGGTAKASALTKFKRGDPKILVATPGRLNDYLSEEDVRSKFHGMMALVLDEADRMLDAGFLPDILKVLRALPPKNGHNGSWQGMCFSATIPPKMKQVLSHVLAADHVSISTIDASEPPTIAKVPQYSVIISEPKDTYSTLYALLTEEIEATIGDAKIIVFGTTANLVALYAEVFQDLMKVKVYALHSRMTQPARTKTTEAFKAAKTGIVFATDVIGRGMDFPDVSLVLQVGLPADTDSYTHRVGRTARAGKDGRAIIMLTKAESFYLNINRQFGIKPYPASEKVLNDVTAHTMVSNALQNIDPDSKRKAYSAYLGFMKGFTNKLQLDSNGLVRMANDFALRGMGCGEVPIMEKKTIGKMGLKGVSGINYGTLDRGGQAPMKRPRPAQDFSAENQAPSRRLRHQGVPGEMRNMHTASTPGGPKPKPHAKPGGKSNKVGNRRGGLHGV